MDKKRERDKAAEEEGEEDKGEGERKHYCRERMGKKWKVTKEVEIKKEKVEKNGLTGRGQLVTLHGNDSPATLHFRTKEEQPPY